MYYVYLIQSIRFPEIFYVGYTTNLEQRLATHNSCGSTYTSEYRPWKLEMYLGFSDQTRAKDFEKYLKSQSGRAFAKKRFLQTSD
ncbi:GIY-YIG nuclease family protein [Candidatus Dependentiae bacterium]|nr:GIY-YIG nuclease family protein [Candidatus Dependentiae bacterium]